MSIKWTNTTAEDVATINGSIGTVAIAVNYNAQILKDALNRIAELEKDADAGYWIVHDRDGIKHLECSECSCWFLGSHLTRNSYCPNCGTKMIKR